MRLQFLSLLVACLLLVGCAPSQAPVVDGPIDTETASKLQMRVRSSNGDKYSATHEVDGESFEANWEISNTFKKNAQMQFRLPGDWDEGQAYAAMEAVLDAHQTKPWYGQIDETVLQCFRKAVAEKKSHGISSLAPATPYKVVVKANHYDKEWFVEVKVQILDEKGMALGI